MVFEADGYWYKERRHSWSNGMQQFQVMAPQLVPPRGTILLTMTSQVWPNALHKRRPANIGQ